MSITKKYKLYIFDLDGTLVDTRPDIARALQKMMVDAGFEAPSNEDVVACIGGGSKNAVKKLTGLEGDAITPHLASFMQSYEEMCSDNTTVYEGGIELLNLLKQQGAVVGLITMKSRNHTLKILDKHQLDMFDEVVTFDDVEKRKPYPDSLLSILNKYDIDPSEALMIGDTVTDMKFAKAAGVDACAMEYGYGLTSEVSEQRPNYLVKSFYDFFKDKV